MTMGFSIDPEPTVYSQDELAVATSLICLVPTTPC